MSNSDVLPDSKSSSNWAISPKGPFFLAIAVCLLLLGSGLRMYHLGNRSLWFDEALTANTSRTTVVHMMDATRARGSAPVIHPYILYLTEKVDKTAVAVRMPSVIASILAIFVMLSMVRAGISAEAALFAAAILALSASQVRYAQEVREYSLAILFATILIYCLLRWEAAGGAGHQPYVLYAALFLVPLVQYGLVLLGFAVLSTIVIRLLTAPQTRFKLSHLLLATASLGAGGLLSLLLTLRYQFHVGQGQWYLVSFYFDPKAGSLWSFIARNLYGFISFSISGRVAILLSIFAVIVYLLREALRRDLGPLAIFVIVSFAITLLASIGKYYPFGGIRQCLFLTPGFILLVGVALAHFLKTLSGITRKLVVAAVLAIVLISGYRGFVSQSPYLEYEDTLSILQALRKSAGPNDLIWVNHDAVEAVDFYLQGADHRFVYGQFHPNPQDYIPEVSADLAPNYDRVWFVFSHLQQPSDRMEEQLIVGDLRPNWEVQSVLAPTNTELFVARRRPSGN